MMIKGIKSIKRIFGGWGLGVGGWRRFAWQPTSPYSLIPHSSFLVPRPRPPLVRPPGLRYNRRSIARLRGRVAGRNCQTAGLSSGRRAALVPGQARTIVYQGAVSVPAGEPLALRQFLSQALSFAWHVVA